MSGLLRHAAKQHAQVRTKILKAQAEIEQEIEENDGIYGRNKGRVSQAELCCRAKIGKATLQGPSHKDTTRVEVRAWLAALTSRMILGHRRVRRTVTDRADAWKQAYHELQDGWAAAELEHVQNQTRIQNLEVELVTIRRELAAAREELTALRAIPGKVTRIEDYRSE